MAEITTSIVDDVADPALRAIAVRVAREIELGMEKVAASDTEPAKFRLASRADSLERILHGRFAALPQVTRKSASMKAIARIAAPIAVREARFGDLARIDLSRDVGVDEQAAALPLPASLKISKAQFKSMATRLEKDATPGLITQATTDKLEFRIHKVKCLDETNGFLGSESGDDEIDLGGTTVDESGDTLKVTPFRVGSSFDDGEQKAYSPPRRFTWFNLNEGTAFPKSYFVTLVLAEVDMGGLPVFIDQLMTWVKTKVTAALAAAIGGAIGASGGPIGAIIGAAVGAIVGYVFDLLKSIWEDDVFRPVTLRVNIPSLNARWSGKTDSPEGVVTFSGHGGKYQVVYDWRLAA